MDVDDCSVDISQENIVLLLKKELPEPTPDILQLWEKFSVGLNASQTVVSIGHLLSGRGNASLLLFSVAGEVVFDFFQCRECDRKSSRFSRSMG